MGNPLRTPRRPWSGLVPAFAALMVVVEIAFLGRLDISDKAEILHRYWFSYSSPSIKDEYRDALFSSSSSSSSSLSGATDGLSMSCEKWLEREDNVSYSRDFFKEPILVEGFDKDWNSCSVGCKNAYGTDRIADATFNLLQNQKTASILRSMESSHYYSENSIDHARRKGFKIIMTTSLSSDVPVGYFSWVEYDIMAPLLPKIETALAAAFISNCGARNFRLEVLETLEKLNISIDSYGSCHRTHDGRVDKVQTLKKYKFSLAFENSNEEDYVTEKFFQSLVAGAIPVVVGAPNIQDFAPAPGSILHIKEIGDVASVAQAMRHISTNPEAYKQAVKWKYEGPSDSFKALVDMAVVHSSCRLCIHLATSICKSEEKTDKFQRRPCKCVDDLGTTYHLFVRERGRFAMESVYLRSEGLTMQALELAVIEKFTSVNHVPIWKKERPESIRGGDELKLYRIYPIGVTQRQALYSFRFRDDVHLREHIESNPCAKFEVIFV